MELPSTLLRLYVLFILVFLYTYLGRKTYNPGIRKYHPGNRKYHHGNNTYQYHLGNITYYLGNECPRLGQPSNGYIVSTDSNAYASLVEYVCYAGYEVVGESKRTCLASGDWSGVAPSCQRESSF